MSYADAEKEIEKTYKCGKWEYLMHRNMLDKACAREMLQIYRSHIRKNPSLLLCRVPDGYKEVILEGLTKKPVNGYYKYIMFTINFKKTVSIEEAKKQIDKCLTKKWIVKAMYCYEWRLPKELLEVDNPGLHVHMKCWIDKKKNPYVCKREVYNTFKHLVGNKLHVNARYSNREKCFEDYIKGYKDGKKKSNHDGDVRMRLKYNLDSIYVFN